MVFHNNDRDVTFNPGFSVGTAAVRGTKSFKSGYHHYWEVEMSTEVYGTDMVSKNISIIWVNNNYECGKAFHF